MLLNKSSLPTSLSHYSLFAQSLAVLFQLTKFFNVTMYEQNLFTNLYNQNACASSNLSLAQ